MLAFGAGVGVSVVGISARALTMPDAAWRLILEPAVWAIVDALTAAVVFAMALQKGGATAVTAIMFTTNTAVSSLIGLAYLDGFRHGDHVWGGVPGRARRSLLSRLLPSDPSMMRAATSLRRRWLLRA